MSNTKIYVLQIHDRSVDVTYPQDAYTSQEKAIEEMESYIKRQTKPGEVSYVVENFGWIADRNYASQDQARQVIRVIATCLWN